MAIASAQTALSNADAAPMVWPIIDLIELAGTARAAEARARSPKTRRIDSVSSLSLVGVPVPWALT